ncbi:MAG TPA: PilC/PilY family type IV pilus protein [Burkholderiales bacterium]|nr:PilC/PilY family type IV pilus protein [Burkholderiales bacterium]
MNISIRRFLCLLVSVALVAVPISPSSAEDIDLFTQPRNSGANSRPNILIILDNSANWNAANQGWPGGVKQGQSELSALRQLITDSDDRVNIGIMMLVSGSGSGGSGRDGAYIRFHMRQMTATNKAALVELIGTDSCVDGPNSLNGTPNCIYKNFSGAEQVATGQTDYSATLFEAYKYLGGYSSPAKALINQPGGTFSQTTWGPQRYSGNPSSRYDAAAYTDASKSTYNPPIDADNSCTSNHVILIGNGFPNADAAATVLSGVGGSTTQLKMPAAIVTTPPTADAVPASNRVRYADEWAKFLFETDVSSAQGQQNVRTYTIDVFKDQQDLDQTRLMKSIAKAGGDLSQYHDAKSESQILDALKKIMIDIQSVNSVFTSATVPVTAANRVQQENEIYFGSFVPDHEAKPRWYGNLKKYQAKMFGNEVRLADKNGNQALIGGAFDACSASFWTTDNLTNSLVNGGYWAFDTTTKGLCPTGTYSTDVYSDLPDSGFTRKGGAAEVLRRGNDPAGTLTTNVFRTLYTCASSDTCPTGATGRVTFDSTNVVASRLGTSLTAAQHTNIIDHTKGHDVNDENGNSNFTETRSTIHGDVVHSRVVPVNYGAPTGVVLYYGSNDGPFRAVSGSNGKELWGFIAPEHHGKLKRLTDNSPLTLYAGMSTTGVTPTPTPKDYFFDGAAGLYQNANNTTVMIYPTMRRGGRMLYALDVTTPTTPMVKWRVGCDETGTCTSGFSEIGQTWSAPNVARVAGHQSGTSPIIVMGGGYDTCDDTDSKTPNCSSAKGRVVYVIDAILGTQLAVFSTSSSTSSTSNTTNGTGTGPAGRSVPADVAFVDRNGDGMVDHAYVADTGGNLFRIDFVDKSTFQPLLNTAWKMTKIAYTNNAAEGRKFLQAPGVLATKTKVYLAIGSGDRERPLRSNYPYAQDVQNRFYMFIDKFPALNSTPVNLDDTDKLANFTTNTTCDTTVNTNSLGWFMGINNSQGEQTVSSALIFGGLIFFNTNAPSPPSLNQCGSDLGQARGYAVNLLNASGSIGATGICGGNRFGLFVGGGLPPTPVAATLPIGADGKPELVLIGAANLDGTGGSIPQGAQRPKPPVQSKRSRVYWYKQGNF